MPMYEYRCEHCGERLELIRSYSRRDEEAACPSCGGEAKRQLSAFSVGGSSSSTAGYAAPASSHSCSPGGG